MLVASRIRVAAADAEGEALRASVKFPEFNSPHEGYAVILEELDELWDHVRADTGRTFEARKECIQIAAMAIRYAAELTPVLP